MCAVSFSEKAVCKVGRSKGVMSKEEPTTNNKNQLQ
jgi:hypothetical protein